MLSNLWNRIKAIATAPLTEELDAVHLFLLVGVVIVAWIFWVMILSYIRNSAEEVL